MVHHDASPPFGIFFELFPSILSGAVFFSTWWKMLSDVFTHILSPSSCLACPVFHVCFPQPCADVGYNYGWMFPLAQDASHHEDCSIACLIGESLYYLYFLLKSWTIHFASKSWVFCSAKKLLKIAIFSD